MIIKRKGKPVHCCKDATSKKETTIPKNSAKAYRSQMLIKDSVICQGTVVFHLCPRCKAAIPRAMVPYWDQCGQCLDWREKDAALPAVIFRF